MMKIVQVFWLICGIFSAVCLSAADVSPIAPVSVKNGKIFFNTPQILLDKSHLISGGGKYQRKTAKDYYAGIDMGYDRQGLVFRIYVNDDHPENTRSLTDLWMQDGVEIFLEAPDGKNFSCGKRIHFMISCPDENGQVKCNILSSAPLKKLPEYSGRRLAGGYEINLRVPFSLLAPYDLLREKKLLVKVFADDWDPSDGDPEINYQPRVLAIPVGELREGNFTEFFLASADEIAKPYALNAWWSPDYYQITYDGRISLPLNCPLKYDYIRAVLKNDQGNVLVEKRVAAGEKTLSLTNPGNDVELSLVLELYQNGKNTGLIAMPYYDLKGILERLAKIDWQELAKRDPVRAAAWLNVVSTVELFKFSAARYRSDVRELLRELQCRIGLLDGKKTAGVSGRYQLLNLTAGFAAQIAVEFDHRERPYGAERTYVSIPWGNIPLVQAEVLQFPNEEMASNYLKWRMAFAIPEQVPALTGADEFAAGRGHLWFSCRKPDRDFKRTVALQSPRYPEYFLHLEFAEAQKLKPSKLVLGSDSPLKTLPLTVDPSRKEPLIAYSGNTPANASGKPYISTYGVETGFLLARQGNTVYETSWNNPELDRRFMQLLLDKRPLTAGIAREFRDLRAAELAKYGKGESGISLRSGDMHTHTIYSDGSATPAGMLAESHYAGLDFLMFSDHNRMDVRYYMDEIAKKSFCGFDYSCGLEATFHNLFHLNIFPLNRNIDLNCHYWEIYRQADAQGALIQLNHPLSTSNAFRELWYGDFRDSRIAAVERNISRFDIWQKQNIRMNVTGGTDTHSGCFSHQEVTVIECDDFSDAALLKAFREYRTAMVAPRLGRYLVGERVFLDRAAGTLLSVDSPEKYGIRLAAKLRNFNAAEYIRASSPVVDLPGCFTIIDKKYNRPYLIEKE